VAGEGLLKSGPRRRIKNHDLVGKGPAGSCPSASASVPEQFSWVTTPVVGPGHPAVSGPSQKEMLVGHRNRPGWPTTRQALAAPRSTQQSETILVLEEGLDESGTCRSQPLPCTGARASRLGWSGRGPAILLPYWCASSL